MGSRSQPYVVIPAYNEAPVVSRVVAELGRAGYAAVVVDDGSRDATADAAHAAGAAVVSHPFNLGQGAALQTGIDYALARGWHQGYPKKLAEIFMTRPVTVGRAGPTDAGTVTNSSPPVWVPVPTVSLIP